MGLLLLIVARLPVLDYPFYWDESWSYAPGVKLMYLHGPSLMPNAIDIFYSRGHPLLFYASAAAWMKIFGDSHIAQHAFCLLVSLLLIVVMYEACLKWFNKRVALMTLLLLPLQIIFFVQTTFLLPEIMIGLFTMLALYYYIEGKYFLTWLSLTALMLTKESGMVLGLLLGINATLSLLNKMRPVSTRIKKFASVSLSGVAIGLYFLLQKHLNGWYFYPEHTGYILWDWHIFWDKFRFANYLLFMQDHRTWLFRVLMGLGVVTAIISKKLRPAILLVPGILIYLAIEDRLSFLPRKTLFGFMLLSYILAGWTLVKTYTDHNSKRSRFIMIGVFFIVFYLVFTCINFFTARYLLCIFPVIFMIVAAWIDTMLDKLPKYSVFVVMAAFIAIILFEFKDNKGLGDINLGSIDAMKVQEEAITWLENAQVYDKGIAAASFQMREHLQKPYTGFLHSDKTFKMTSYDVLPTTDYLIFDNIEPDINFDKLKTDTLFYPVYKSTHGEAMVEIYRRKK